MQKRDCFSASPELSDFERKNINKKVDNNLKKIEKAGIIPEIQLENENE